MGTSFLIERPTCNTRHARRGDSLFPNSFRAVLFVPSQCTDRPRKPPFFRRPTPPPFRCPCVPFVPLKRTPRVPTVFLDESLFPILLSHGLIYPDPKTTFLLSFQSPFLLLLLFVLYDLFFFSFKPLPPAACSASPMPSDIFPLPSLVCNILAALPPGAPR